MPDSYTDHRLCRHWRPLASANGPLEPTLGQDSHLSGVVAPRSIQAERALDWARLSD